MEAIERDRAALEDYKREAEKKMKVYFDLLISFLNKQHGRLDPSADELLAKMVNQSRNNVDEHGNQIKDQADLTNEAFDGFLYAMGKAADRRQTLEEERKRCETILEMKDITIPLDIAMQARLNAGKEDLAKALELSEQVKDHSQDVFKDYYEFKSLTSKEGYEKDKRLQQLEAAVKKLSDQNQILMDENNELRQKRKDAEANWKTWKERCHMLEKTRKLGYYNPGE